jgi:hypothetical protein
MRVNARFEGEYERQMEFLTQATGLGVSEVLKASVEHYYRVVSAAAQPRLANLRRFMGRQGSGRTDVSVRAKELFGDSVSGKARHHK